MTNSADPDQLASSEANWSGSTLFAKSGHVEFSKRKVKLVCNQNYIIWTNWVHSVHFTIKVNLFSSSWEVLSDIIMPPRPLLFTSQVYILLKISRGYSAISFNSR